MEFRTKVDLADAGYSISHKSKVMLLGSCFAENIGRMLLRSKFQCMVNPYGILYNPMSVCKALNEIIDKKIYVSDDLFHFGGLYHSFMHHSSFSGFSSEDVLRNINGSIVRANDFVGSADVIIITLGTSFIYEHNGEVVSNCHKLPERNFTRKLCSPDLFAEAYKALIDRLIRINPSIRIIFTISPVRHIRDSLHGNMLSKSVLAVFIDCIQKLYGNNVIYFPSYEIMIDELRDYRFYADDMLHPSDLAIKYIWDCFSQMFFERNTVAVIERCEKISRMMEHRPFNFHSEQFYMFVCKIEKEINKIVSEIPELDFTEELNKINSIKNEI